MRSRQFTGSGQHLGLRPIRGYTATKMMIPETLVQAVRGRKAILFAGAGLSCTLGLPLFDVLTSYLGSQLNLPDWKRYDFPALAEYYLLQTSASDELFRWMRKQWHRDDID